MSAFFQKQSAYLLLALYGIAVGNSSAASWEGTDSFTSGISQTFWTLRQQAHGTMSVSGVNGHASFLVPVTATTEQEADLIWNGQPTAGEDFTVEITGLNAASFSTAGDSQLQLVVIDARALTGGAANSFTSEFARGASAGATQAEFQSGNFGTGLGTSVASVLSVTNVRLRVVYKRTSQTFEAWFDDSGTGTNWKLLRTASLTAVVPDGTPATAFAVGIIANCYFGPITEGQLYADNFNLANAVLVPPVITSPGTASATVGQTFNYQITASNSPTNFNATGLPAGLSINAATGVISGIPTSSGTFMVTVSAFNAGGTVNNSVTVTVAPDSTSLWFTAQPQSQTVSAGDVVCFSVTAPGATSYQWLKDGVILNGATNASYWIANANNLHSGSYRVAVSKVTGTVISKNATLTLNGSAFRVVAWGSSGLGQTTVPSGLSGVVAIAAGEYHTVVLKNDGTVVAWGYNSSGQANVPIGLSGVAAIAAGASHTVALKNDGTVVAWGDNAFGQVNVPDGLSGVVAVAAGPYHTVALRNDGTVVVWGLNSWGQTNVPGGLSGVVAIAGAYDSTVALKSNGVVVRWGRESSVPAAAQSGVVAISAGVSATLALKNNGSVLDFGNQSTVPAAAQSGVVAIAAAGGCCGGHAVALKGDGAVLAWGRSSEGQTTAPAGLSGVVAVAAGGYHTVALTGEVTIPSQPPSATVNVGGSVTISVTARGATGYQWLKDGVILTGATNATHTITNSKIVHTGTYWVAVSNATGSTISRRAVLTVDGFGYGVMQWGSLSQTVPASARGGVLALAAKWYHIAALKNDGTAVAWGLNDFGQTTLPAGLSGLVAVAVGRAHTVVLKTNGAVLAWGHNASGETTVPTAAQSGVVAVDAGNGNTVALRDDGTVVAWGYNRDGQTTVPAGLSGVLAVAAGEYHTVALKKDGTVVAWGLNDFGQTTVPSGLSGVVAVAAGNRHTLALKSDRTVVAWGAGGLGQSVHPHYGQSIVPVGLNGVAAIAAGFEHSVVMKTNGTVVEWGRDSNAFMAVPLAAQSGVSAIAAGSGNIAAILVSPLLTLSARSPTSDVTLQWPDPSSEFRVESALAITPPISWNNELVSFQTNDGSVSVVLPVSGPRKFYRLAKP
jgi:alpha-tubulin suppressor-like RCC1 family protein